MKEQRCRTRRSRGRGHYEEVIGRRNGRALPIVKARLKVADFDKTIDVTDDMVQATFTAPLKKGNCDILAELIGRDGKKYGAYFLCVTRE